MSLSEESRRPHIVNPGFLIGGNAYGISAIVKRRQGVDVNEKIHVKGNSVLPIIGGYSIDRVEGKGEINREREFVTFDSTETEAEGFSDIRRGQDKCSVRTRATVNNLWVAGRFNAPFLQAALDFRYASEKKEPNASLRGTTFGTNMMLDDEVIHVSIDENLAGRTSESEIARAYAEDPKYERRFFRGDGRADSYRKTPPRLSRSGYMMYSIVDKISIYNAREPGKLTKARVVGHTVSLDNFGTIYFGEMMVRAESRKLTLLRFELGCRDEGRVSICGAESIGEFCPP